MDITVDELMSNAFVLTVNQSRLNAFMKRWDMYGLKRPRPFWGYRFQLKKYVDTKIEIGSLAANCSFSHYAMIKMAEAVDLPFIFILEDDALPCRHILDELPKALKNIPDDTWVLRLGSITCDRHWHDFDKNGITEAYAYGSHAYIVFKSYYKKYEEVFNNHNCIADGSLINHRADTHGDTVRIFTRVRNLFIQKNPISITYSEIHPDNAANFTTCMQNMPGGDDFDYDSSFPDKKHILPIDMIYALTSRRTASNTSKLVLQLQYLELSGSVPVRVMRMPSSQFVYECFKQAVGNAVNDSSYFDLYATFGNYLAWHDALDSDLQHVLFMDDSAWLLNDKDKVLSLLEDLPADTDLAVLDWGAVRQDEQNDRLSYLIEDRRLSTWIPSECIADKWSSSALAYVMSKKAMTRFIAWYDSYAKNRQEMPFSPLNSLISSDFVRDLGLNVFLPIVNMADKSPTGQGFTWDFSLAEKKQ